MATTEHVKLEVATPGGMALEAEVTSVQAPSVEGELGVLPGHLPLLAAVKPGLLKYRVNGYDHVAVIDKGFLEVSPSHVLILSDRFVAVSDISPEKARQELIAAEEALKNYPDEHTGQTYEELKNRVDWAAAQLEALSDAKPH